MVAPFPTPWPKLSLVVQKCFANLVVWLTGPRRHCVVLGSFIPRLYSGTLISLLFGLNVFANSILGSRDHIHPEICIMYFLNSEPGSASLCPQAAEILHIEGTLHRPLQIPRSSGFLR